MLLIGALALAVSRVDAGPRDAAADPVAATGAAVLTKGLNGDAILRTGAMKPGRSVTGTVTVGNSGDATGAFRLAQIDVLDTPGEGGGRLSAGARLRVDDLSTGRPVYAGVLGKMDGEALGYLRAGERRTYRFTLSTPAAMGRRYTGSQVETTFDWTAATGEPPAGPTGPDGTPPLVVVQSPPAQRLSGRRLTIAVTCDERCTVPGGSPPRSLAPGRPGLRTIELSRAQSDAAGRRLERQGQAAVTLRVPVTDQAGNRTTARVRAGLVP